jgi:hypothetical protein
MKKAKTAVAIAIELVKLRKKQLELEARLLEMAPQGEVIPGVFITSTCSRRVDWKSFCYQVEVEGISIAPFVAEATSVKWDAVVKKLKTVISTELYEKILMEKTKVGPPTLAVQYLPISQ